MDFGLKGRTCIVTGASRGIGLEVATEMAEQGVDVAMLARDVAAMEQVAPALRRHGVRVFPIGADLRTEATVRQSVQQAIAALGRVDILVNNVSGSAFGTMDQISDQQWLDGFALKPLSYIRACREVLPGMRAQRHGRIVNVCGAGGRFATANYIMGGLNAMTLHFTKALAEEVGPDGINVVAVNPGPTGPTDRTTAAFAAWAEKSGRSVAEVEAEFFAGVPMRRMATPREMARLIVFMASDIAEFTAGGALQADGGMTRGVF